MPEQPKPKSIAWRTEDELAWLKNIGQHWRRAAVEGNPSPVEIERRAMIDRDDLLRSYQVSMASRKQWGNIDRFAVMKYLSGELDGGL